MTLRQPSTILAQDQRQMCERGWLESQSLIDEKLPRRVCQVIFAADDMVDLHGIVVKPRIRGCRSEIRPPSPG